VFGRGGGRKREEVRARHKISFERAYRGVVILIDIVQHGLPIILDISSSPPAKKNKNA